MTTIYVSDKDALPERHDADLYVTEHTLIVAALKQYAPLSATSILDIGAGDDGRWGLLAQAQTGAISLTGIEMREIENIPPKFTEWYTQDFLSFKPAHGYDLIVSNPPYYIAEPIIRKAWDMLLPGGTMMMLLRLSFLEGVTRYQHLWQELPVTEVGVCARRPSFYGGKTNGTAFAIFVWAKDMQGNPSGKPLQSRLSFLNYEREKAA